MVNPSPYMIYLQARGSILVASSPEILCRLGDDGTVTNRWAADRAPHENLLSDPATAIVSPHKQQINTHAQIDLYVRSSAAHHSVELCAPTKPMRAQHRAIHSPRAVAAGMEKLVCLFSGRHATHVHLARRRPLAGTRWRGRTEEEDLALEADLLADEKECAEHVMLVDLGRNDVGRVRL